MKKYALLNINLLIGCIIVFGAVGMTLVNYHTYRSVILEDIQNISILTSSNIYSEINSELAKPVYISLTMANDEFLKDWIAHETDNLDDRQYLEKLRLYLDAYRKKYHYNSVFLISSRTKRYYHYEGLFKVMGQGDPHDVWYELFIQRNKKYFLNIDQDQVDHDVLSIFVDCRVESPRGELLGVVGVGLKMREVQDILDRYSTKYDVRTCLVQPSGVVQVESETGRIARDNIFNRLSSLEFRASMLGNRESWQTCWYPEGKLERFIVTRYVPDLDWFLVVEHDTSALRASFLRQLAVNGGITLVLLALLLSISSFLLNRYRRSMFHLVSTDELTGMPNRRAFNDVLQSRLRAMREGAAPAHDGENSPAERTYLFIFDIDRFKHINDTEGHICGDTAIVRVGRIASALVGSTGMVARWGGDEFIGLTHGSDAACTRLMDVLRQRMADLAGEQRFLHMPLTVSVGITALRPDDTMDSLLTRADEALYKAQGRNRCEVL